MFISCFRLSRLLLALTIMPLLLLIQSCGNDNGSVTTNNGTSGGNIELPTAINAIALPSNGSLNAYISVDGGARQALTVDLAAQEMSGSITGISPGNHQFIIEVIFVYDDSTEVVLARASTSMDVGSGDNNLSISAGDYDTAFDDDNDGISNLTEMNDGLDPTDSGCVIGSSLIGSCTLS